MENNNYQDGDAFVESVGTRIKGIAVNAKNPGQAVANLVELLNVAADVYKFTEAQGTLREEISAKREIMLEKIKAQKELMLAYLAKSFDERKINFESLFKRMDVAIEKNEVQQLAILADSINKLAASSPFKVLADSAETMKALSDDKHEWNF